MRSQLTRVMKTLLSLVVVVCALGAVSGYPRLTRPQQHNRVHAMMENKYELENPESEEEFEIKIAAATLSPSKKISKGPSIVELVNTAENEKVFEIKTEAGIFPNSLRLPNGPSKNRLKERRQKHLQAREKRVAAGGPSLKPSGLGAVKKDKGGDAT